MKTMEKSPHYMTALKRSVEEGEFQRYNILHLEDISGENEDVMREAKRIINESVKTSYYTLSFIAEFSKGMVFTAIVFRDQVSCELWGMKERSRALYNEDWMLVNSLSEQFKYKLN